MVGAFGSSLSMGQKGSPTMDYQSEVSLTKTSYRKALVRAFKKYNTKPTIENSKKCSLYLNNVLVWDLRLRRMAETGLSLAALITLADGCDEIEHHKLNRMVDELAKDIPLVLECIGFRFDNSYWELHRHDLASVIFDLRLVANLEPGQEAQCILS